MVDLEAVFARAAYKSPSATLAGNYQLGFLTTGSPAGRLSHVSQICRTMALRVYRRKQDQVLKGLCPRIRRTVTGRLEAFVEELGLEVSDEYSKDRSPGGQGSDQQSEAALSTGWPPEGTWSRTGGSGLARAHWNPELTGCFGTI